MKQYKEVDNSNGYSTFIAKGQRFQKIKYTVGGEPFVTRHGVRYHIDLFETRLGDPKAYHFLTYFDCLTLEIDDNGEYAKLGYEYTSRSSKFWKEMETA